MRWMVFIVIGSLVVGFGRLFVPGHELSLPGTYEAFAHIWVGILLAVGLIKVLDLAEEVKNNTFITVTWLSLVAITAFEVYMFINK
jgi:hypothetical protein